MILLPRVITSLLPGPGETQVNQWDEVSSIVSATPTVVVTYTVPVGKTFYLDAVEYSGQNVATFEVTIDAAVSARRRTYFGGSLSGEFFFNKLSLSAGQVIELVVEHARPDAADFDGRIVGVLK